MAYTRREAREKLAELLAAHEYTPGVKTFAKVWSAQMKEAGGLTPVAMVWNGPLWFSTRRTADAAQYDAGLRVALMVSRNLNEENTEDWLDRSARALLQIVEANIELDGFWRYIEFSGESYLDFPPVETGTQYRREIIDLRVYLGVGV
jgi:hypothetical protein